MIPGNQLMLLRQKIQILFTICSTYVSLFLHSYHYIDIGFSRVQRDSTPRFVHPSVCLPFHLSVAFYFFMWVGRSVHWSVQSISKIASGFCITAPAQASATGLPCIRPHYFFTSLLLPKCSGDLKYGPCLPARD